MAGGAVEIGTAAGWGCEPLWIALPGEVVPGWPVSVGSAASTVAAAWLCIVYRRHGSHSRGGATWCGTSSEATVHAVVGWWTVVPRVFGPTALGGSAGAGATEATVSSAATEATVSTVVSGLSTVAFVSLVTGYQRHGSHSRRRGGRCHNVRRTADLVSESSDVNHRSRPTSEGSESRSPDVRTLGRLRRTGRQPPQTGLGRNMGRPGRTSTPLLHGHLSRDGNATSPAIARQPRQRSGDRRPRHPPQPPRRPATLS